MASLKGHEPIKISSYVSWVPGFAAQQMFWSRLESCLKGTKRTRRLFCRKIQNPDLHPIAAPVFLSALLRFSPHPSCFCWQIGQSVGCEFDRKRGNPLATSKCLQSPVGKAERQLSSVACSTTTRIWQRQPPMRLAARLQIKLPSRRGIKIS